MVFDVNSLMVLVYSFSKGCTKTCAGHRSGLQVKRLSFVDPLPVQPSSIIWFSFEDGHGHTHRAIFSYIQA